MQGRSIIQSGQPAAIATKLIGVVEIFTAQAQAEDSLFEQLEQGAFAALGIALIGETDGQAFQKAEAVFDLAQERRPDIRDDVAAVKYLSWAISA